MEKINNLSLVGQIKLWSSALGFQQIAISNCELEQADQRLQVWLAKGYHGHMGYLTQNRELRRQPDKMLPKTISIISARMNYLPQSGDNIKVLRDSNKAYISRYALGRDYHRLIRKRLKQLAKKIESITGPFNYRPFADSAPVFEKPIAEKSGLGWMGKHTLILNREAGSYFFLGTLYTDLPLPEDKPVKNHCGSCSACIDVCPTKAIVAPYQLDARRCISYLTIENKGAIPIEFREQIGNRIFGCDDCQLMCPWNKYAKHTSESAFNPRHRLDDISLVELFLWTEQQYLKNTEGSALRRCGYEGWLRNIAVALGNAPASDSVIAALKSRLDHPSDIVKEHVLWALQKCDN
ncbi:MAG: tRNA epoxyqueuosine(34) reductase QueG [Gammaproteobacteria bacterium]|nr:tRNA epoxyqueuosine(34) reductase QueG [Gammaproteobacteria bacterium]